MNNITDISLESLDVADITRPDIAAVFSARTNGRFRDWARWTLTSKIVRAQIKMFDSV